MTELEQLADDILQEMYQEAEPPLDYLELKENPEQAEDGWYRNHYLSSERQQEIFDEHIEGENLTDAEHSGLVMECLLNLGPSNVPLDEQKT